MCFYDRLSITKWIHMNNGDEGLMRFFQKVYDVLKPGGVFLLEPQEWKSYATARGISEVGYINPV